MATSGNHQNQRDTEYYQNVQRIMEERVPELRSKFSQTPIAYDRWREPTETMDNGQPGFLSPMNDISTTTASDDRMNKNMNTPRTTSSLKTDYIFVSRPSDRKHMQPGYYHMRTAEAHVEAYRRFCVAPRPPGNSRCFGGICRLQCRKRRQQEVEQQTSKSVVSENTSHTVNRKDNTTTTTGINVEKPKQEKESTKSHYDDNQEGDDNDKRTTTNAHHEEMYYYREAKRILYNRTWTPEPDDILAQQLALVNNQSQGSIRERFARSTYLPVVTSCLLILFGGVGR